MMKNYKITGFLWLSLFLLGGNLAPLTIAQETQRSRVSSEPTPTPTPQPSPTAAPTPAPLQYTNVSEVVANIRNVLARPDFQRGHVGVKIVSLDTGKTVFEQNADKYFMPASNMKSYTVATAIEKLSPNFRFVTSVFAGAPPDVSGTVKGDLTVFGRGDISFSTSFYEGDYYKGLDALAEKIAQAGVKRIEGNLIGDASYFLGNPIPSSWEWDDLQWYYGAEISALPLNDNALDLSVKPGTVNLPCIVQLQPFNSVYKIVNQCVTSGAGTKRDIKIVKKLDQNILEITGTMPSGDKGFAGYVTVSRPAELFVALLKQRLEQKGIVITGQPRVINVKEKDFTSVASSVEIAKLESPPMSVIAAKTMKPSQNLYTETILWTLGEEVMRKQQLLGVPLDRKTGESSKETSAEMGTKVVQDFLKQIGIAPDSVIQYDGSGLSRHNLITPNSAVQLYTYMAKRSPYSVVWMNSLTIGATDGTLRNRFKGTSAAGNVRGKTGTIDQVSALSGYVTSAAGEKFVFSVLVNGVPNQQARQAAIDEIVLWLAKFNGRTE